MIYFDNAATSFPKPKAVIEAMEDYFFNVGGNTGRSGHRMAIKASELVFNTRELLARLFNISDSSRIVFTKNITESLNLAVNGFLEKGDQVVTTSMEHNSVMRPLRYLEQKGQIKIFTVQANKEGLVDPAVFEDILKKEKIKLVAVNHASNVTGSLVPVDVIAEIVSRYGSSILVDAAQTAGAYSIDVLSDNIDMLAFTGHKSLLGPQGTGGLYVREGIKLAPLVRGGTGSNSEKEIQPNFLPDQLESGTMNIIGIAGLGAGVKYVLKQSVSKIRQEEMKITKMFVKGVGKIDNIEMYGPRDISKRVSVVSFNIPRHAPSMVAYLLDKQFNLACRSGLHCSPSAHKTIGTFPRGTLRFSFGYFNDAAEVEKGLTALIEISRERYSHNKQTEL
ncbi:MAG: aminotransferase class V-fold PLP-dependent enzyme [Desulfitobacteriaceae bacterium]|nr:aminotransferase class V-fold PLP-dependent enzyme [Desulfitobacteriaceae bacterium]